MTKSMSRFFGGVLTFGPTVSCQAARDTWWSYMPKILVGVPAAKGLPYGGGPHLELQMDWHRERTTMAYEMNVHLHH